MVTDKLTSTNFAKIILLLGQFFAIFLYICTLAVGAMKSNFYLHMTKITLFVFIVKLL